MIRWKKNMVISCLAALLIQLPACSLPKSTFAGKLRKHFTILGFGDSITEGSADFFSYLFPLDSMLKSAGYDAEFIGPRSSQFNGITLHHFGYGGRTAEYLAARADSVYSIFPADIVLLHSGHNHFVEEAPVPGIIGAQRKIIQTIREKNPSAIIFVATVITSGKLPKYDYIPGLNTAIRNLVDSLHDPRIQLVDQEKNWNWSQFTITDKVHPNRTGARVIAAKWFDAIQQMAKR